MEGVESPSYFLITKFSMTMKKLAHKQEIAEWYAEQIMQHWQCPYDEIEWLVNNLKEDAMSSVADSYYEYQREVKENNLNNE